MSATPIDEIIIETGDGLALVVSREPGGRFLWLGIASHPDELPDAVIRLHSDDLAELHRAVRELQLPGAYRWPNLTGGPDLRVGCWITWGRRGLRGRVLKVLRPGERWRVAYDPPGDARPTTVVVAVADKPRRVRDSGRRGGDGLDMVGDESTGDI